LAKEKLHNKQEEFIKGGGNSGGNIVCGSGDLWETQKERYDELLVEIKFRWKGV
jgi:hypothetical protein